MIQSREVYTKANRILCVLDRAAAAGTLTPEKRERRRQVADEVLIWEWSNNAKAAAEITPTRAPSHPTSIRFLDWWKRNRLRQPFVVCGWRPSLWWWMGQPEEIEPALWDDLERVFTDKPDMIMVDLEEWNRHHDDGRTAAA